VDASGGRLLEVRVDGNTRNGFQKVFVDRTLS
jgi:hypothetical protein